MDPTKHDSRESLALIVKVKQNKNIMGVITESQINMLVNAWNDVIFYDQHLNNIETDMLYSYLNMDKTGLCRTTYNDGDRGVLNNIRDKWLEYKK